MKIITGSIGPAFFVCILIYMNLKTEEKKTINQLITKNDLMQSSCRVPMLSELRLVEIINR